MFVFVLVFVFVFVEEPRNLRAEGSELGDLYQPRCDEANRGIVLVFVIRVEGLRS